MDTARASSSLPPPSYNRTLNFHPAISVQPCHHPPINRWIAGCAHSSPTGYWQKMKMLSSVRPMRSDLRALRRCRRRPKLAWDLRIARCLVARRSPLNRRSPTRDHAKPWCCRRTTGRCTSLAPLTLSTARRFWIVMPSGDWLLRLGAIHYKVASVLPVSRSL